MKINYLGESAAVVFAAEELCRILKSASGHDFEISGAAGFNENTGIYLGEFDRFPGISPLDNNYDLYDDEIFISVEDGKGIIAGINPRSVLIAVYRFLTELGCRFVGFGESGELIPQIEPGNARVSLHERAYYKHRGVCIEGAVSGENVRQMVDLLPKLGMNSYFIQFREAYTFFDRWYSHIGHPKLEKSERLPVSHARGYVKNIEYEIKKRGLLYHAVGHGWTCEPFGVPGLAWEEYTGDISPEVLSNFAEINGERGLCKGVPLNTNACYSNKNVRNRITDYITEYAKRNNSVDLLHVWLADGENNQCECADCAKHLPSDLYVLLLNELDEKFTVAGIDTKIVFLIYVDLLWPPKEYAIKNRDRFLIMFAPITRTYRKSFRFTGELPDIPRYIRNRNEMPVDVASNISFLKHWQNMFKGSGFDFDYHYMWAHIFDPGYVKMAGVLSEDIKNLDELGLHGYISCQVSRAALPNALGLYVMGKTLWDKNVDFSDIKNEYFRAVYGDCHSDVCSYLSELSDLYFELNFDDKDFKKSNTRAGTCEKALICLKDFGEKLESMPGNSDVWIRMKFHNRIWHDLTEALLIKFKGDSRAAKEKWIDLKEYVFDNEDEYQPVFDVWNFANLFNDIFK